MAASPLQRPLVARVELQGLVVLLDSPRVVALRLPQPGASDVRVCGAHAVCDRRTGIRQRAVVILEARAHVRSQVERHGIAGLESNYSVEIRQGAIGVLLAGAQGRSVEERLRVAGIFCDRLVVGRKGFTFSSLPQAFVAIECRGSRKYQPTDVREVNLALGPGHEQTMCPQEVGAERYLIRRVEQLRDLQPAIAHDLTGNGQA